MGNGTDMKGPQYSIYLGCIAHPRVQRWDWGIYQGLAIGGKGPPGGHTQHLSVSIYSFSLLFPTQRSLSGLQGLETWECQIKTQAKNHLF